MNEKLLNEAIAGARRGWCYTPLRTDLHQNESNGKIPRLSKWTRQPPPGIEDLEAWVTAGDNLGIRTGLISKLVVIDFDTAAIGLMPSWPETATVETGSGGFHLYYRHDEGWINNSNSTIAKGIDVRGDGGQVVAAGSIHLSTGNEYAWLTGRTPEEVGLTNLPLDRLPRTTVDLHAVDMLRREKMSNSEIAAELGLSVKAVVAIVQDICKKRGIRFEGEDVFEDRVILEQSPDQAMPPVPTQIVRERDSAMRRCLMYVDCMDPAIAGDGGHNATINVACVARRFGLDFDDIITVLEHYNATCQPPWSSKELRHKASEAIKLVPAHEVGSKLKTESESGRVIPSNSGDETHVPIPGAHYQSPYIREVDFCVTVIDRLPDNLLYRRDRVVGKLLRDHGHVRFAGINTEEMQILLSEHIQCMQYVKGKDDAGEQERQIKALTIGQGRSNLLLAYAGTCDQVRSITSIVSYPVFAPNWTLCEPGWNRCGVYFDAREWKTIDPIRDEKRIRDQLLELVIDFPFEADADRDNFFGLLLTAICRPAILGAVPMHACIAPVRGSGKTLLLARCVGQVLTGDPMPTKTIPRSEDEMNKQITSMMMRGDELVLFDNLNHFLDSSTLASLITSAKFGSRVLGQSRMVEMANNMVLMMTGNNISMTEELARRTVVINLQPMMERPEYRSDFKHPDLHGYIDGARKQICECLVGMVLNWREAGEPIGEGVELGSFNSWSRCIGGILELHGFVDARKNEADWLASSDPEVADMATLIEVWIQHSPQQPLTWLMEMAESLGLFSSRLQKPTEKGREVAFGCMLRSYRGRVVGQYIIDQRRTNKARLWEIKRVGQCGDHR